MNPVVALYIFIALAIVLLILLLCAVARSADEADTEIERLLDKGVPPDLINEVLKENKP